MPLLTHNEQKIDGIVDLKVSGSTMKANKMKAWEPALTKVYPVLIANKSIFNNPQKRKYLDNFLNK